ncbi:S1 family peptidase [Spirosoma knui]
MNSLCRLICCFVISQCLLFKANALLAQNMNTWAMESTFKIAGYTTGNQITKGTVFMLLKPSKRDSLSGYKIMITAAHVLDNIKADSAVLYLRKKRVDSTFVIFPVSIPVRKNGVPLWTRHPTADVAVMYVFLPAAAYVTWLNTNILASEKQLIENFDLQPGKESLSLGFPKGFSANEEGFPILRTGRIASYPIFPVKRYPLVLYDAEIFEGNSGGPVYNISTFTLRNSVYDNTKGFQQIIGLVSVQVLIGKERLVIGGIILSPYILETIDMLPNRD